MEKHRPFGVTLLAILAGVASLIAVVHTLQMLHILPITGPFGEFRFFAFDLFGALMWGMLAAIYIWLVKRLWAVDPAAWMFLVIVTVLNLIFATLSVVGGSSIEAMMGSIAINAFVLLYCLLPGTKEAFGADTQDFATGQPK